MLLFLRPFRVGVLDGLHFSVDDFIVAYDVDGAPECGTCLDGAKTVCGEVN